MKKLWIPVMILCLCLCGCDMSMPADTPTQMQTAGLFQPTQASQIPVVTQPPEIPTTEALQIPVVTQPPEIPTTEAPQIPVVTLPPEIPTTEAPQIPVTTLPPETEPTPVENQLLVQDQFTEIYPAPYDSSLFYCIHIPQVIWNGRVDPVLNDWLYIRHMEIIGQETLENGNPGYSAFYRLGQGNGFASVITRFDSQEYDFVDYHVMNLDMATGQEATKVQILAAFGYSMDSFRSRLRQVMEARCIRNFVEAGAVDREGYAEFLQMQTSDEVLDAAQVFVDESGRLAVLAQEYGPAGKGYWLSFVSMAEDGRDVDLASFRCDIHD